MQIMIALLFPGHSSTFLEACDDCGTSLQSRQPAAHSNPSHMHQ
jgi:hypothetical protein